MRWAPSWRHCKVRLRPVAWLGVVPSEGSLKQEKNNKEEQVKQKQKTLEATVLLMPTLALRAPLVHQGAPLAH